MPDINLGFPFDPELFLLNWQNAPDPTLVAMITSGAVQRNATIANLISNGSDIYTIPFYDVLGGTPDNYDGVSNITVTTPTGDSQSGVVYGRAHSWKAQDFVRDFNSGADPMRQITSQVAKYWNKQRQSTMLKILDGIFASTDNTGGYLAGWKNHVYNIAASEGTIGAANMLGATSAANAMQKALGDNSNQFSMAFLHSHVATNLAGLELLEFRKYTDESGIQRTVQMADYNGLSCIIDDACPAVASTGVSGATEYSTYLLGEGALQFATAPVTHPVETDRDTLTAGGFDFFITRKRETLHPNGFTFKAPSSGYTKSPPDAQLGTGANWLIASDPKSIAIAKIISNG